jgi:hypothetical protein
MLKAFQDHIDSGGGIGQVNEEVRATYSRKSIY